MLTWTWPGDAPDVDMTEIILLQVDASAVMLICRPLNYRVIFIGVRIFASNHCKYKINYTEFIYKPFEHNSAVYLP